MTEMLVTITGFGSIWRRRFGKDKSDSMRFARAAYFNTSGVPVNGKMRTRSKIAGHIRFNAPGGFDPHHPLAALNSVFECADPCVWNGQNKVLFKRKLPLPQQPDYFLVVVKSREVGWLRVGSPDWRSEGTLLISLSEGRDQQEAMLLIPREGWLYTDLGRFVLRSVISCPCSGRLQLEIA
jgi:hypothetical protein